MHGDESAEIIIDAPHLNDIELRAFEALFTGQPKNYLEFGIGGSSLYAIRHGVKRIVAVDSDPNWVAGIRRHPEIAPLVETGTASILYANIGPIGAWGTPNGTDHVKYWHRYISEPWAEWNTAGELPDLVFVDGRFRAACILSVLLVCAGEALPMVVVHDVSLKRPQYAATFKYFDVQSQSSSLVVMKPKTVIDRASILDEFLTAQFDSS